MTILHMASIHSTLSTLCGLPGSGDSFHVTSFCVISSNASNFHLRSRRYFFIRFRLSFKSLSFFFNYSKFACRVLIFVFNYSKFDCRVLISFWSFSTIWLSSFFLYKRTKSHFEHLFLLGFFRLLLRFHKSMEQVHWYYSVWKIDCDWVLLEDVGVGSEGSFCLKLLRNCYLNLKTYQNNL